MHARAVRRAPVVDDSGNLVGIITLDDLLPAVSRELEELSALIGAQARHERALQTMRRAGIRRLPSATTDVAAEGPSLSAAPTGRSCCNDSRPRLLG